MPLAAICGGVYLAFLDTTIVNTSFPDIGKTFTNASTSDLSWILDAYFICIAAFLIPAGGLADRIGRKRLFLIGIAAFTVTSVLCSIAPSWQLLTAARALQGISSAIIIPVSTALLLELFEPHERSTGVGIWGAAAALAAATGPPLGGILVDTWGWRAIFLVNLPLGLLIYVATLRSVKNNRHKSDASRELPDLIASLFVALGLGTLALAIIEGNSWGWTSWQSFSTFGASLVLMALVVWRCLTHHNPLVDPSLFKSRSFTLGNVGTFLFAMAFFSTILGNILFLTNVWQYSVLNAGLAVVPGPLFSAFIAGPAGKLADRLGHRVPIVPGTILYAIGLMIFVGAGTEPNYLGIWLPGQILVGLGIGLAFPTLGAAAASQLDEARFAPASAIISAFRQFGAVVGTAALVAIIGTPTSLLAADQAAGRAYTFGIIAVLLAGLASMPIRNHAYGQENPQRQVLHRQQQTDSP